MELVNEVLDITQIENGQLRINSQPVNIPKLLDDFPPMLKQLQGDKKLNIICNQHDLYQKTLFVDPLRLKQIYTNILSNAIKYTPDGGSVTFEIYEELFLNNKYINLIAVISDTGIGMSQEYINHMYSKFSRATDSRINKVGGYGLGLSIVKELVDLMNGRINVTSKEGHGTTFKIIIPLECCAENYKALQDISDISAHDTCKGMHLLVAEDNTLNYEVISELLAMYGITCDHAEDGSVCVEMFRESSIHTYDAILMDMQMPVMDGLQATSAIRNLNKPGAHSIPIIAMTANAFKDDIQRCLDAGMNMHMSKPVNMEKLLKALAKFKGEISTTGNGETSGEVVTTPVKTTDNIETTGETVTPVVTTTNGDSINGGTTSNNATNGVVPKPSTTSTSLKASSSKKPATTKVKKVKATKKSLTIKWSKVKGASGYEIQVATDKKFKKNKKSILVKKQKTTSAKIKKLKSKKKYYVRVRTYKVVGRKKVYSSWINGNATKTK